MGCNGKLNMVCCKICNEIDGREKLLVLKFDIFGDTQKEANMQDSTPYVCCGVVLHVHKNLA